MSDTLTLLPPNATARERALARLAGRITALAVGPKYRALWNPQTCPAGTLPWLAWSLHVDEWDSNWTEQQKRDVIAASVAVHKTKGTIGALKRALAALGYEVTVDENTGEVYTFRLEFDLNQTGIIGTDTFAAARRVAMANKNARSKLLAVRSSLTANAGVYGAVAHHRAQTVTVDCGRWNLPPDEHTLLQVQVDAAGNIVERTGNGTITTSGTVIVDHTTTHDGLGSIRNTAAGSTTAAGNLLVTFEELPANTYTFEGWFIPLDVGYPRAYAGFVAQNTDYTYFALETRGSIELRAWMAASYGLGSNSSIEWKHFALVRVQDIVTVYINGIISFNATPYLLPVLGKLFLGRGGNIDMPQSPCCWENIRVSNIARYTENFTPPGRF